MTKTSKILKYVCINKFNKKIIILNSYAIIFKYFYSYFVIKIYINSKI